jgi:copper chaperone
MMKFTVNDMSCGHCVSAITQAVKAVDPNAQVQIKMDTRMVEVESAEPAAGFMAAMSAAGYKALLGAAPQAVQRSSCCGT